MSLFNNKSVGIDISDRTIEVAELSKNGGGFTATSLGRVELPVGVVEKGEIKDEGKLMVFVRKALANASPIKIDAEKIVFGLPENHVYIHTFFVEENESESVNEIVLNEALANIPIPSGDLLFSYKVLSSGKGGDEVLIVATSNQIISQWQNFFQKMDIKVEIFDIESLAVFRGLISSELKSPICLVDFGATTTHISIFDKNGLQYAYTSKIGGEKITEDIAIGLNKNKEEAEELKRSVGLSKENKNKEACEIIEQSLGVLTDDINKNISYFKERTNKQVSEIIFVGGSSALLGLGEYLRSKFGIKAKIGKNIFSDLEIPLIYIEAVGLALRGFKGEWDNKSPIIIPSLKNKSKVKAKVKFKQNKELLMSGLSRLHSFKKDINSVGVDESKLNRQKIILLFILVFGIVTLPASYWYRGSNEAKRLTEIQESIKAIGDNIEKQKNSGSGVQSSNAVSEDELLIGFEKPNNTPLRIIITETPTGWLNVRSGPATEYPKVTKIYPGDTFNVLLEKDDWYKIKVDGETDWWITSLYTNETN